MKTTRILLLLILGIFVCIIHGCTEESIKVTPKPVNLDLSELSASNPQLNLGRVLFYDTKLSVNNSISCASCHKQALAFGDNQPFSKGYQNENSARNTLPIQNLGSVQFSFFWDGRESNLPDLVLQPVFNHVEMGMDDLEALIDRIRSTDYYGDLFFAAYHDHEITSEKISYALYSFIMSLGSNLGPRAFNENLLSAAELEGMHLFNDTYDCGSCHQSGSTYYGFATFSNIGLDLNYADKGRFNVSGNPVDEGKFRVPSLVNVALTAPYMHDGRFETLDEVLEHYSHNISNHPNLDTRLKSISGNPLNMDISQHDKDALITFLGAFTDMSVIGNHAYSNPFKY